MHWAGVRGRPRPSGPSCQGSQWRGDWAQETVLGDARAGSRPDFLVDAEPGDEPRGPPPAQRALAAACGLELYALPTPRCRSEAPPSGAPVLPVPAFDLGSPPFLLNRPPTRSIGRLLNVARRPGFARAGFMNLPLLVRWSAQVFTKDPGVFAAIGLHHAVTVSVGGGPAKASRVDR